MKPFQMGICLMVLMMVGCESSEERSEARIEAAVAENMQQRETQFYRKCRREAVERAAYIVDSLLLERAMFLGRGDEFAPPRPERPDRDRPEVPPDSLPLAPMFARDSLR
jgi:hypothetical protein